MNNEKANEESRGRMTIFRERMKKKGFVQFNTWVKKERLSKAKEFMNDFNGIKK